MDASVSDASSRRERTETEASGQAELGPESKKTSLKRKSKVKARKPKKARLSRPDYTVHQGEDMLLVISNASSQYVGSVWTPKRKGGKKRKALKGKVKPNPVKKRKSVREKPKVGTKPAAEEDGDGTSSDAGHRWGRDLPEEVLVDVFQMVVVQDGAVPFLCRYLLVRRLAGSGSAHFMDFGLIDLNRPRRFHSLCLHPFRPAGLQAGCSVPLCRVGRVCRLWNAAASSPALWRRVTVGHCWTGPGKTRLPKTETRVQDTVSWLAQNRFLLVVSGFGW